MLGRVNCRRKSRLPFCDPTLLRMLVDLGTLKLLHPKLPAAAAAGYVHRAAVALQRAKHASGVNAVVTVEADPAIGATVSWNAVPPSDEEQLDRVEITEHGAEGVSLVLVSVARGWKVDKRLQRYQYGDWLMVDDAGEYIALEVSGMEGAFDPGRLRAKLEQVGRQTLVRNRCASVVAFKAPEAVVARV